MAVTANTIRAGGDVFVLWVSRHRPLPAQLEYLEKRLGDYTLVQLIGTIPSAEFVAKWIEENVERKWYRKVYVIPVLPLSIIARLVELGSRHGFTVLWSEMRLLATTSSREEAEKLVMENPRARTIVRYADGIYRVFEFVAIHKVKAIRIETEPF